MKHIFTEKQPNTSLVPERMPRSQAMGDIFLLSVFFCTCQRFYNENFLTCKMENKATLSVIF